MELATGSEFSPRLAAEPWFLFELYSQGARIMPLSKDEQRQLEEIERALLDDDPLFTAAADVDRKGTPPASVSWTAFMGMGVVIMGAVATESVAAIGLIISLAGFSV